MFAIANSIKYVQVVYIAKWVGKSYLMIIVSFFLILVGLYSIVEYQIKLYCYNNFHDPSDPSDIRQHEKMNELFGYVDIATAALLALIAIIQLAFFSMEPLDSDLILYEQCIYLSSAYSLPKLNKHMRRSDFMVLIDKMTNQ